MSQKFLSDVTLSTVTAGSMLKLDANGKIVEAVDGTDYISTSSTGFWTASSGSGIYYSDDVRIGTYQTTIAPDAKLHVFDYQTTEPKILIEDGNTGDASMQFKISTQSYTIGVDNSDSDKFVLSAGSVLGTGNLLEITSNGLAAFQDSVLIKGTLYVNNQEQIQQGATEKIATFQNLGTERGYFEVTDTAKGYFVADGFKTSTASTGFLKADGSVDTGDFFSGAYSDLTGTPTLGTMAAANTSDYKDSDTVESYVAQELTGLATTTYVDTGLAGRLSTSGGVLSGALNVLYNDHANGTGWDKNLFIGTSDDLGLAGAFPTYVPSGSYGFFSHANSDGVFIGSVPTAAGSSNYYATIAWGDDSTEYLQFLYKGTQVAYLETDGDFYIDGSFYSGTSKIATETFASGEAQSVQDNLDSLAGSLGTAAYTASTDYAAASHNHDSDYINVGGDTMTGILKLNAGVTNNNWSTFTHIEGAYSVNNPSGTGGAIRIDLPTAENNTNTMMTMTVKVYEYSTGKSFTLFLGGYNYTNGVWYNTFASMVGDDERGDIAVRFGNNGERNIIWIGEPSMSWSYPNVWVTDFQSGHTQGQDWNDGWRIVFDQTEPTNVTASQTAHKQITTGNIGSYGYLTSYTETDTLSSVAARGSISTTALAVEDNDTSDHWAFRVNTNGSNNSGFWTTDQDVRLLLRNNSGSIKVDLRPDGTSYFYNALQASSTFTASSTATFNGIVNLNGRVNFDGVNGQNFTVNTDGDRIIWDFQRNGTRRMSFYHKADQETFNFAFESGSNLQINGNRILTTSDSSGFLKSGEDDSFDGNLTSGESKWIKFYHPTQSDSNDGKIGAGVFDTGLNIVGVQTVAGTGRQVRVWGDLITSTGAGYATESYADNAAEAVGTALSEEIGNVATAVTANTTQIASNRTAILDKLSVSGGTMTGDLQWDTSDATTNTHAKITFGQSPSPDGTLNGLAQVANYGADGYGLLLHVGYGESDNGGIKITDDGVIVWGASDENVFTVIDEDSRTERFRIDNSGNITASGTLTASGYNASNWDTAYGWGNHAGLYDAAGSAEAVQTWVNEQNFATDAAISTAIGNLIDSSPANLDTLNELAAALGDDANFSTTVTNSIATKLPLAGGTLTGDLTISQTDSTSPGYLIHLHNASNTNGATIKFSDTATQDSQYGNITFYHQDGKSYGSGASFIIGTSEATSTILADGKLMYAEGIYSKPSSGTGAGTRKDANWDTAYGWGNHASAGYASAGFLTNSAGAKLEIQNATDGGTEKGIYMWQTSDPNWVIYMAQAGTGKSAAGGNAVEGLDGTTGHAIRFRVNNNAEQTGFIWENSSEEALMQLNGGTKNLYVAGRVYSGGGNSGQWDTAYSWGNHASAGYLTSATAATTYQPLGNYFTDGDTVLNMANNDGLVYNDTNNTMYIKKDGTNYAIIDSGGGTMSGQLTASGGINMGNTNITNVNHITINDAGYGEGVQWSNWMIYDSPDDLSNQAGNFQISSIADPTIRVTVDPSGNLYPSRDRLHALGLETNRWQIVFCEILDSAGQHEKNLQNPEGEKSVGEYDTGTVLVWKGGKNIPCTEPADHMRMGIAVKGMDSPLIQGAEPVLVTGSVNEGDYLVTSSVEGHAKAITPQFMRQHGLYDCVLGKALESAEGKSHLVKTWINI